ncbi:MAG: peptidase MA family metallohydrolase [Chloroflexota bacterium]
MNVVARVLLALALVLGAVLAAPAATIAAEPVFGQPNASAPMGEPLTVTSTIDGVDGGTVELVLKLAGHDPQIIVPAHPGTVAGGWEATAAIDVPTSIGCSCFFDGNSAPNSHIEYQFRVRAADGTTSLGPVGQVTVTDDRFQWRTIEQGLVRVHWYEGDDAFAQAAADVANTAIDHAAELLGSTLPVPVDLFIYATQDALLEAVSANRENIAGEAHSTIATMFVWLPPDQAPERKRVVVAHELTHLVFNVVTENPFHEPPRWLNEGIAVYLSEGYTNEWSSVVSIAAREGTLIPLPGIAGFFPSPVDQFFLAYGESVSAVDYFIRTYSEPTLWELVRSYSQGLSDDDAFMAATTGDMAAFNAAWMASLGAEVPVPLGPQPAPPGPVPSAWTPAQPTSAPGSPGASRPVSSGPGATLAPGHSAVPVVPRPTPSPTPYELGYQLGGIVGALVLGVLVVLAMVVLVIFIQRGRRRPPPPPYY